MRNSIHNFKKEKPTARMDAIVNIIRISVEMKRINDAFVAVELFFYDKNCDNDQIADDCSV